MAGGAEADSALDTVAAPALTAWTAAVAVSIAAMHATPSLFRQEPLIVRPLLSAGTGRLRGGPSSSQPTSLGLSGRCAPGPPRTLTGPSVVTRTGRDRR